MLSWPVHVQSSHIKTGGLPRPKKGPDRRLIRLLDDKEATAKLQALLMAFLCLGMHPALRDRWPVNFQFLFTTVVAVV